MSHTIITLMVIAKTECCMWVLNRQKGGNDMTQPSQATVQRMFDYLWKIGAIQRTIEKKEAKQ